MKKKEWATPNRMKFDSLHKTFNMQTQVISTGNILSNTLHGGYIRAANELECNGIVNPPGHLQAFDLQQFSGYGLYKVLVIVRQLAVEKSVILYVLKHYTKGKRIVDGAIITTTDHKKLYVWCVGNAKQWSIVDEASKYLCEEGDYEIPNKEEEGQPA
jgi:hypothetical protein